jgi:hypothetical protein
LSDRIDRDVRALIHPKRNPGKSSSPLEMAPNFNKY